MCSLLLLPGRGAGQVLFSDNFEVNCPAQPCGGIITQTQNCLPMWFTSHGTPQIRTESPAPAGNRSLCMTYNNDNRGEGAFRTLPNNGQFLPCQIYTLAFRIRTLAMPMPGNAFYQIVLTNTLQDVPPPPNPPICSGVIPTVSPMQVIFSQPVVNFPESVGWTWITCHFVPDQPFSQLWVSATATGVPVPPAVVNMFCIDDLSVALTGPVPQASVTASVQPESVCPGEAVEIRYRICNAVGLNATTYTVLAGPLPTGITIAPGSVNPVSGTIAGGICVANSNCTELVFQLATAPNQAPGSYTIPLTVGVQSQHNCIQGWKDEAKIEVRNCAFTCPCEDPDVVNTHINADDYGTTGEVLLNQLIADGTLPAGSVSNRCIAIRGSLRVDADYDISDCEVRMQSGAGIVVQSHWTLRLLNVTRNGGMYGCSQMWRGILVQPSAIFVATTSWVADARRAVEASNKSNITLRNNVFRRNYTSLFCNSVSEFTHAIEGNLFAGADLLLPPYAGQTPAPGTRPFAGVDVTGQSMLHIGTENRFESLRNGIITVNTHTKIVGSTFENILRTNAEPNYPFTGHAVRHSGGAAHALTLQGLGKNAAATFHNCTEGVWATGTDVDVQEARMTAMSVGVTVRLASNRNIALKNNNISAGSTGISLQNNDPAQSILVTQNNVNIGESNKSVGIRVDETNLGHHTEAVIFDNAVSTLSEATGIRLRTAADYHIAENSITLSFPDGEAAGIRLLGVQESRVTANKIQGTGQLSPLLGGTGMDVRGSNDVFYDCNSLSNLHTGARFGDVCNGTEMQATMFSTPMRVGLHYLPGLTATPQLHEGNQWLTTGGNFGEAAARNDVPNVLNIASILAAQRYEVHSTAPPFYPPSFAFPNLPLPPQFYAGQWFLNTVGTPDPCGAEPDMLTGGGEEELRLKIAQGGGFEGEYTSARLWQARRNLYAALAAQSGGVSGGLLSFYQNNQAGLQGGLYNIEYGKRELYQPAQMLALPMAALLEDMRQLADEIAEQDSLIWIEEGNEVLRQSLLTDFGMKARAVDSLEQLMLSARFTAADNLLQQNSLLPGSAIYETNALDLNTLYLSKPARRLADFTPSQMADLEFIAGQCPAAGGRAVWQARSLLALGGVDILYDEDCFSSYNQWAMPDMAIPASTETLHPALSVYPNPGNSVLNIAFAEDFQPAAVLLVDLFGRAVYSKQWVNSLETSLLEIDVSRLPVAIYQLMARDAEGTQHTVKVSITR